MCGSTYGDLKTPTEYGSGSTSSNNNTYGLGGGIFKVDSKRAIIDGVISASGQAGYSSTAGGGSGGSIWLNIEVVEGGGQVKVMEF